VAEKVPNNWRLVVLPQRGLARPLRRCSGVLPSWRELIEERDAVSTKLAGAVVAPPVLHPGGEAPLISDGAASVRPAPFSRNVCTEFTRGPLPGSLTRTITLPFGTVRVQPRS
jgi:hypothetical protein